MEVLPSDNDSEKALLGAMIVNNDLIDDVVSILSVEDLFSQKHRIVYKAILRLHENKTPIDEITLGTALSTNIDQIGGVGYLIELSNSPTVTSNARHYCKSIKDCSKRRAVIIIGNQIASNGNNSSEDYQDQILRAQEQLNSLQEDDEIEEVGSINDLVLTYMDDLEEKSKNPGELTGATTGLSVIDNATSGLQKENLIIVAARPSMGKSAFAYGFAYNHSKITKKPTLFFSLEMSKNELMMRTIASEAKINTSRLMKGDLDQKDWDKMASHYPEISEVPVYISSKGGVNTNYISRVVKNIIKKKGEIGMVVIDYLQLMSNVPNGSKSNKADAIGEITRTLKQQSKDFSVPYVVLSQLNRELEKRTNKRPQMSDLRDSGSIEADADVIMFLYRDYVYNEGTESPDKAEIIIAKNRNGDIGMLPCKFEGQYTRFSDYKLT